MKLVTAIIKKGEKYYVGECVEIDVVTQGKTIDETLKNIEEAVALYFKNEDISALDLPSRPPITYPIEVSKYAEA